MSKATDSKIFINTIITQACTQFTVLKVRTVGITLHLGRVHLGCCFLKMALVFALSHLVLGILHILVSKWLAYTMASSWRRCMNNLAIRQCRISKTSSKRSELIPIFELALQININAMNSGKFSRSQFCKSMLLNN